VLPDLSLLDSSEARKPAADKASNAGGKASATPAPKPGKKK
jgi:hypothetical protein